MKIIKFTKQLFTMTILSLQDLCIDYIVKTIDHNSVLKKDLADYYFEEHIFFIKHKMKMSQTFRYLQLVNNDINNNSRNASILSIKYLVAEDFFSYDHLLVTFCTVPSQLVNIDGALNRRYVRCHSFIRT